MKRHRFASACFACAVFVGLLLAASASAEEPERDERVLLLEATGAYGVQFGRTDYLPDGSTSDFKHPLVNGYAVGGTVGMFATPGILPFLNYEFTSARSRTGDVPPFVDAIRGQIRYHSLVAGVRLYQKAGPGLLRAELALGVTFPYQTELRMEYGPGFAMLPEPITGTGTRIEEFCLGFGGHGALGYEIPLGDVFHIAPGVKLKTFQSNNSCGTTRFENFVDPDAPLPVANTGTVRPGSEGNRPSTNSVQDVRIQLAVGASF